MKNIIVLDHPAKDWEQGLPLGNGRLGAMVLGQLADEQILLNEETLFYGKMEDRHNPDTRENIGRVRALLRAGKVEEAAFLARAVMLGNPRYLSPFVPAGILRLSFHPQRGALSEYSRCLDIDNALATVNYRQGSVPYRREYFTSLKTNVLAARLSADKPFSVIANLNRRPYEEHTGKIDGTTTAVWGRAGEGGVNYFGAVRMLVQGGEFEVLGDSLAAREAESVVLYTSFETDYRGNSAYREKVLESLKQAEQTGYEILKKEHSIQYHELYDRMEISLNECQTPAEPTDRLLEKLRQGGGDEWVDYLSLLEFNMGRYLLIASSWNCRLPANLQGIWNGSFNPPWESVYTININLQMNYWPAEVCGLSECTAPLFDLIDLIAKNGRETARRLYGARGFAAHHNTNLWGDTAPVGVFDSSPFWVMGGAWLALHLYEHYQYTLDLDFLKTRAFPVIEEALAFFLDYLTEDEQGLLHTGPSLSPENIYITRDGQRAALCMSPAMDIQIIRELYRSYAAAADVLGIAGERKEQITAMVRRLPETSFTADGRIREWLEDYEEAEPGHRHISHLFALHPGSQITEETPELYAAARKTLEKRLSLGGGHTGWSCAWVIMFFARLKDGQGAYKYIRELLAGKTSENMLNVHPPFQIDGNFGFTAAVTEMLVQSHAGYCELLPALPGAWGKGRVRGLRLRGAVSLDMSWSKGALEEASFTADTDIQFRVKYRSKSIVLDLKQGIPSTVPDLA